MINNRERMEYKYSELFKWNSGKPFSKQGSIYPVFGSNGIIGYSDDFNFSNKIILGRVGAYCGSVNYFEGNFFATDNTLVTECDESKIIYKYAYYLLKSANLNSFAGGSAQPLITQSILKHLKCAVPPLPIQRRIASILSTYDALIQNYKRQIAALQSAASELYKEWFVRFRFPGYKNAKFDNGLPEGWKVEKLGNLAEIKSGKRLPKGTDFSEIITNHPYIRARDIKNGNVNTNDLAYISDEVHQTIKKYIVEENDILLTIVANIGDVGYVTKYMRHFNLTENAVRLTNYASNILPRYLCYYLVQPNCKIYMEGLAVGAAQAKLGIYKIENIKILVPNKNVQEQFEIVVSKLLIKVENLRQQITNLTTQRDLLLPRLMSGKLSVE